MTLYFYHCDAILNLQMTANEPAGEAESEI